MIIYDEDDNVVKLKHIYVDKNEIMGFDTFGEAGVVTTLKTSEDAKNFLELIFNELSSNKGYCNH